MYLLRLQLSTIDIILLQVMAIVLGFVIHFVLVNRRRLQNMIEESKKQHSLTGTGGKYGNEIPKPATKRKVMPIMVSGPFSFGRPQKAVVPLAAAALPDVLQELKQNIRQQQKTLDQLVNRVNKLDAQEEANLAKTAATAMALEEKEAELRKTKHQLGAAKQVAGRVTEVYQEFDELQEKMAGLEESASKANELVMELEDMQQAYAQLKKDLSRKQEKLHEAVEENTQLHQRLAETEDKLMESNLQRQQLAKKVQLLENMNTELQQMSESHKKLKNDLRRIGELESMLSLVSDERDLLKKRFS